MKAGLQLLSHGFQFAINGIATATSTSGSAAFGKGLAWTSRAWEGSLCSIQRKKTPNIGKCEVILS